MPKSTLDDTLAAIDIATGCQQCGGPLVGSVSDDFCRPGCQESWHAARTERLAGYREPWDRPWDFPGVESDAARFGGGNSAGHIPWASPHADIRFDISAMMAEFERIRTGIFQVGEAATRFATEMVGAIPHDSTEIVRQRALRLQRERGTGPARNPHARRGRR